eukprot:scaffold15675_cov46-Prasinocladus_malaysianus.AAC.2
MAQSEYSSTSRRIRLQCIMSRCKEWLHVVDEGTCKEIGTSAIQSGDHNRRRGPECPSFWGAAGQAPSGPGDALHDPGDEEAMDAGPRGQQVPAAAGRGGAPGPGQKCPI